VVELLEKKEHGQIIALAENSRFLRQQADCVGPRLSLETYSLAIKLAFKGGHLAEVAALTIARAEWGRQEYAESPLEALRKRDESRALDVVARMENQNDRTLWHLALAAYHANGKRPQLAARILDEHIPRSALREKLSGGMSMCAASLLCLLVDVRTSRFQWGWFLAQLTDDSKTLASRALIRRRHANAAWSMLGSIGDDDTRESARLNAVRELSCFDSALAERQLARFGNPVKQEWAVQEMVSTYASQHKWPEVNRLLEKLRMPRQRAKALSSVAAELKKVGNIRNGQRAFSEAIRVINNCEHVDQQALASAEFGMVQAEHGFLEEAERAFARSFSLLKEAEDGGPKVTKIKQAARYVALMSSLASIARRFRSFMPMMNDAMNLAREALAGTSLPGAKNETQLRMLRVLARWGHFTLADRTLMEIDEPEIRRRATGLLSAYKLRYDSDNTKSSEPIKQARDYESRLEIAGISSMELEVTNPVGALEEICSQLYVARSGSAWRWGRPLIIAEAAAALAHTAHSADSMFECAADMIRSNLGESKCGWALVDLASARLRCGDKPGGKRILEEARICRPDVEENEVRVLGEIEALEIRHELWPPLVIERNGIFGRVWAFSNDNLRYKLRLLLRLVRPFAKSGRKSEVERICSFVHERLGCDAYQVRPEDRCELAGEFAAELAKGAFDMATLYEWARQFSSICKAVANSEHSNVVIPDTVLRADSVSTAEHDFESAVRIAWRIPCGRERSKALRDLGVHAVRRANYTVVPSLCRDMVHHRSEHLADLACEIADHASPANDAACDVFKLLVLGCSDYPDAAYRAVAASIRFFKPQPEVVLAMLSKLKFIADPE